jgi:tetratricopeptide (TPR) repeat protein
MDALLAVLSRGMRRRRQILVAAAVAAALLGVGGSYFLAPTDRGAHCRGPGAERIDLGAHRREALRTAFGRSGKPYAATMLESVTRRLDAYAREWTTLRRDSCEARWLRQELGDEALGLRNDCLDQRRRRFDALVSLLATPDSATVERALQAVEQLPPVATCADATRLAARPSEPAGPEIQRRVDEARQRLAQVEALLAAGRFGDGLPLARALVAEALALPSGRLRAESLLVLGRMLRGAGHLNEAATLLAQAMDRRKAAYGPDHPKVLADLAALADLHQRLGRLEETRALLAEAVATGVRLQGEGHVDVATARNNLGDVLLESGALGAARREFEEAARIWRERRGPLHADVALDLFNQAEVALRAGSPRRADPRTPGPGHRPLAAALSPYQPTQLTSHPGKLPLVIILTTEEA